MQQVAARRLDQEIADQDLPGYANIEVALAKIDTELRISSRVSLDEQCAKLGLHDSELFDGLVDVTFLAYNTAKARQQSQPAAELA